MSIALTIPLQGWGQRICVRRHAQLDRKRSKRRHVVVCNSTEAFWKFGFVVILKSEELARPTAQIANLQFMEGSRAWSFLKNFHDASITYSSMVE
jgi:hypothetical protein